MKILITGGAGFIGSHLVEHFQERADIRVLDNLRTGNLANLEPFACDLIGGSVTDRSLVRDAVRGVDYIFHLAAMVSVPESMENPIECVHLNTEGTLVLLEEAARAGVKKLAFSSSAAIYGDSPELPKTENMAPQPQSPYAITKLDGEYYCQLFTREAKLNTVCLRYFNVFGPRQDLNSPYAAAVPIFIERALNNRKLEIFGQGDQTRDFIYVKDVIKANHHLISDLSASGVYNVAYGDSITINELARKIIARTGATSSLVHRPERSGDVKHSRASTKKLQATGFKPSSSFDHGLVDTVKYFAGTMAGKALGITRCLLIALVILGGGMSCSENTNDTGNNQETPSSAIQEGVDAVTGTGVIRAGEKAKDRLEAIQERQMEQYRDHELELNP